MSEWPMKCFWCNEVYDTSVLLHICPDGASFYDRRIYAAEGRQPPQAFEDVTKAGGARLTKDDREFLKGIKVIW